MGDGFKYLSLSNGFGPQGAPHFCGRERTYAKLGRFPPTRAHRRNRRPSAWLGSVPGPPSILFFEQTRCLDHNFSNKHVCLWRHFVAYIYSRFSQIFFFLTKFSLPSSLSFVRLFYKQLSSSESSDYVPLRRNEVRSILEDDCPLSSVLIEGPNSS